VPCTFRAHRSRISGSGLGVGAEGPLRAPAGTAKLAAAMSIVPFLRHEAFDPEIIETMSSAFARVCAKLGLSDRTDPITEIVARHVIEAAQRGIRSETALYFHVLREFKSNPQ
jgi:hypothetical protein